MKRLWTSERHATLIAVLMFFFAARLVWRGWGLPWAEQDLYHGAACGWIVAGLAIWKHWNRRTQGEGK